MYRIVVLHQDQNCISGVQFGTSNASDLTIETTLALEGAYAFLITIEEWPQERIRDNLNSLLIFITAEFQERGLKRQFMPYCYVNAMRLLKEAIDLVMRPPIVAIVMDVERGEPALAIEEVHETPDRFDTPDFIWASPVCQDPPLPPPTRPLETAAREAIIERQHRSANAAAAERLAQRMAAQPPVPVQGPIQQVSSQEISDNTDLFLRLLREGESQVTEEPVHAGAPPATFWPSPPPSSPPPEIPQAPAGPWRSGASGIGILPPWQQADPIEYSGGDPQQAPPAPPLTPVSRALERLRSLTDEARRLRLEARDTARREARQRRHEERTNRNGDVRTVPLPLPTPQSEIVVGNMRTPPVTSLTETMRMITPPRNNNPLTPDEQEHLRFLINQRDLIQASQRQQNITTEQLERIPVIAREIRELRRRVNLNR